MRNTFINTLTNIAETKPNLFVIAGDLGYGVLNNFIKKYPNQFINSGIAEQNMTSIAAGMALEGKICYTYSIANFPTLRCLEQIRNDITYHNANVKIVSVGSGFSYGSLGMSHHATEDIAIMRALPGITIFTPCDPIETIEVAKLSAEIDGPCYIRLGKGGEKTLHKNNSLDIKVGKPLPIYDEGNIAIFVCGSIAQEACDAATILRNKYNIKCKIFSFPSIKPLCSSEIIKITNDIEYVFTIEEHNIIGGFGSSISEIFTDNGIKLPLKRIAINDTYVSIVGSQQYLRECYGLNSSSIVRVILKNIIGEVL